MKKLFFTLAVAIGACLFTNAQEALMVDAGHSFVNFESKHMGISTLTGSFTRFKGNVAGNKGADLSSAQISFTLEAGSVSTGNDRRDAHLRGADFFDTAKHKEITFVSTKVMPRAEGSGYMVEGNMTIKGVTKAVTFSVMFGGEAKNRRGGAVYGFKAVGRIQLADFGIADWAKNTGISTDVDIIAHLELAGEMKKPGS
jgi:polyisoprenoid-binding protein YceI